MGVETALIAATVAGTAGQLYGAHEQAKAIKGASSSEAAYRQQVFDLINRQFEEYAPYREAALQALPGLQEEATREPGTGAIFQQGLQRGIEGIREQLRQYGLADSTVAGKAIGELTAGATTADINRVTGLRQALLGGAGAGYPQAQSLLSLLGGSYGRSQELGLAQGAVKGASYGAIGDIFSQLPLVYGLLKKPQTQTNDYVFNPNVDTALSY